MTSNQTKAKLKAGGVVFGPYVRHADPGLAEVLCYLGWDYILFDGEHSPISARECEHLARVCELTGVTSIARVPSNTPWMIGQHLDTGIQGIQIPMVNSATEAEAVVRAAKYYPLGSRGMAAARAANYGQVQPFSLKDYTARANAETLLIAQVETLASIDALPDIIQVPDIDVIFIGPNDLSHSLGVPGDLQHPDVQAAFDRIVSIVQTSDKALGILVGNVDAALHWQKRGARYIMVVLEALLAPAVRDFLKSARCSP